MHWLWSGGYFELVFVFVENLHTFLLEAPTFRFLIDLVVIRLEIPHVLNFSLLDDADIDVGT